MTGHARREMSPNGVNKFRCIIESDRAKLEFLPLALGAIGPSAPAASDDNLHPA